MGVLYVSKDKEKIREFSDLRRLQLPTRLEISNFRSDVDAPTSVNNTTQNSKNVNPSGENISRTLLVCQTFVTLLLLKNSARYWLGDFRSSGGGRLLAFLFCKRYNVCKVALTLTRQGTKPKGRYCGSFLLLRACLHFTEHILSFHRRLFLQQNAAVFDEQNFT